MYLFKYKALQLAMNIAIKKKNEKTQLQGIV